MGVKIREKVKGSGDWWIFIHYRGKRASKLVGSRKAALKAAVDLEKEIALERFNLDTQVRISPILFRDYAEKWMTGHVRHNLKESTYQGYRAILDYHLLPEFGLKPLSEITRDEIKALCYRKVEEGLAKRSVTYIARTLSSIFNFAIEDGIVNANPAARPGRYIKVDHNHEKANILTQEEGQLLLETAKSHSPRFFPLLLAALRTGMRQGELIGLQWDDIDWTGKFIEVRRASWNRIVTTPKNGKSRRVDMSNQLAEILSAHKRLLASAAIAKGRPMADWVFPSSVGTPLEPNKVREAFYLVLKKAGLRRIRFHDLPHSFASWLIANREPLKYIQEQLGHHSIQITADTYGHLIPGANQQAVNRLDDHQKTGKTAPQAHPAHFAASSISAK